jgi:hypothetical protein
MNDFASDKIDLTPKTRALLDSISQGTFSPKPNLEHDRFLQACGGTELIKPMAESIMPALLGDTHVDCKKLEAGARQMFWPLYLEYYKDIDVAAYEAYAAVTNFADVRLKMANQFVKSVNSWGKAIDSMAQREINKVFFRVRIKPNDRQ